MGIGEAVKEMLNGNMVYREGWNGKGMWLALMRPNPDESRGPNRPYVVMRTADGSFVPWLCSQTDLLATDWHVIPDTIF